MSIPRDPSSRPDDGPDDDGASVADVFAGLVPIDVVDGELVPRRSG